MSKIDWDYPRDRLISALVDHQGLENGAIIGICLMIDSEERTDAMLDWLAANPEATQSDILEKAAELSPDMDEENRDEEDRDED